MISDDRLAEALRNVAAGVTAPEVDLVAVRTKARSNRVRAASVAAVTAAVAAVAVAVIVASTTLFGGRDTSTLQPASNPLPSTAMSTPSPNSYTSSRYGFTVAPPLGWTWVPATRDWTWEVDARDTYSPAHEAFLPPDHDVRVSAWTVPLDPGTPTGSSADLVRWVEDYCQRSPGTSPCTGIADRAVELCLEQWNCHAGLLVPFEGDVQAFFVGGIHGTDAMTVVAVWRPEAAASAAEYGGSRKLLESFLASMGVWPSTTQSRGE